MNKVKKVKASKVKNKYGVSQHDAYRKYIQQGRDEERERIINIIKSMPCVGIGCDISMSDLLKSINLVESIKQ